MDARQERAESFSGEPREPAKEGDYGALFDPPSPLRDRIYQQAVDARNALGKLYDLLDDAGYEDKELTELDDAIGVINLIETNETGILDGIEE